MARGDWDEGNKTLAGFYMHFVSKAKNRISKSPRGTVAVPVKANWGPAQKITTVTGLQDLRKTFGSDVTKNLTAYEVLRLALLGTPNKIISYRMTDGKEKKASVTLKDSGSPDPKAALEVNTIYPTDREFNVTIRESLESASKQELIVFDGMQKLESYVFSDLNEAESIIDGSSEYIEVKKQASGPLKEVSNEALSGGDAGVSTIKNKQYMDAMNAFEAHQFNAFVLDDSVDSEIQTSVFSWVKRLRNNGKRIMTFMGGSREDDKDPSIGNKRSKRFNHEGVINVTTSAELDGKVYPSSQVAAFVAGKAVGQALKESLTFADTPFTDVFPHMTPETRAEAVKAGSFVLFEDDGYIKCGRGINTLTQPGADQHKSWRKIRFTRLRDAIDTDLSNTANDEYVGKVINNSDGQTALLSAIKLYLETFVPELIKPDFTVQTDEERMKNAGKDQYFWEYYVTDVDTMEEIYGTGNHQ